MKAFAIAVNLFILAAMALVYTNHVYGQTVQYLETQIQIERTVAQVLLGE